MSVRALEVGRPKRMTGALAGFAGAALVTAWLTAGCGGATSAAEGGEAAGAPRDSEEDLDLALPRERAEPSAGSRDTSRGPDRVRGAPADGRASAEAPVATPATSAAVAPERERAPGAGGANPALARRVDAIVARAMSEARKASKGKVDGSNTVVAVHLVPLGGGAPLVAARETTPVLPASNLKVLTVATALELLGPDADFETSFEAHGTITDGALRGDLVARAGGDPFYAHGAGGSVEPWLDSLAGSLRAAGISRVEGRLLLDDTGWEAPGVPSGWPSSSDHWQAYCARSGGFTLNAGCLTATVTPTHAGRPARVELHPRDPGLDTRLDVRTGKRRSGNDVRVGATASTATVRGALAEGESPFQAEFAHPDPRDLFGHAVVGGLARRGIAVVNGHALAARPTRERVVARLSTPIRTSLVPILRDSNNPVADQLFFATGHAHGGRGDRAGGAAAMRDALARLGVSADGLVAVDGSGLSKTDRCTAAQLTAVLRALAAGPTASFEPFLAALPLAGETGKVATRMRGTAADGRVRAKTGFVNGASSLSGYVDTLDGGRLAFAILVNYPQVSGLNNAAWKPMQDDLCALFAELTTQ